MDAFTVGIIAGKRRGRGIRRGLSAVFERLRRAGPVTARIVGAVFDGDASVAALALPVSAPQAATRPARALRRVRGRGERRRSQ